MRRVGAVSMAAILLAAGCGSGDDEAGSSASSSAGSVAEATTSQESSESASGVDPEIADDVSSDEIAEADQLATTAIDLFGSPDAAMDAVLFALDAGYSGQQIEDALVAGELGASGVVDGTDPDFPPTDLVVGLRRSSPEPLPVDRLRAAATEEAAELGLVEAGGVSGRNGVQLLLLLVTKKIPPQAIVEAMILGFQWPSELDVELADCPVTAASSSPIVVAGTVYPPEGCGQPYPLPDGDSRAEESEEDDAVSQEANADDGEPATGGDVEDGTYSGVVDKASEFGQFFADLEGVAAIDVAEMVVSDGTVTEFGLELSGIGASNVNVSTGERLCENPISITAELSDPGGVEMGEGNASVPVTFRFAQEVGSGPECFEESNVAFDETFDDIASIVFEGTDATATLTAGIGATMSRNE